MNQESLTADISQTATRFIHQFLPDLPTDTIRVGGAILLGTLALLLLLLGLRMLRASRKNGPTRVNVPRTLQKDGVVMDLLGKTGEEAIAARCVITAASSGKIKCEIIERLDAITVQEGKEIVCQFAPIKTDQGKVNAFTSTLVETDTSGRHLDRIVLSAPLAYGMTPRRKHTRKRVADQQFIRIKLWTTSPYTSDIPFEDATPQIGVNTFVADGPDQSANAVINISGGGLGLSVLNGLIPETCVVGTEAAINIFMFNFKEKTFKPYWYVGTIRTMEEGRPGFTRLGLEFTGQGQPADGDGHIRWFRFDELDA